MSGEQNQTAMKWKSHFLFLCPANQNYDNIREANQILVIHQHNMVIFVKCAILSSYSVQLQA